MAEKTEEAKRKEQEAVQAGDAKGAEASPEKAKESPAPKKSAPKKTGAQKPLEKKGEEKAQKKEQSVPEVKSAVITGTNPNVEFYRISEDLPVHLL